MDKIKDQCKKLELDKQVYTSSEATEYNASENGTQNKTTWKATIIWAKNERIFKYESI